MAATLFEVKTCGRVLARAHDGRYEFVLVCHLPDGHEGPCRVLGWTEAGGRSDA